MLPLGKWNFEPPTEVESILSRNTHVTCDSPQTNSSLTLVTLTIQDCLWSLDKNRIFKIQIQISD